MRKILLSFVLACLVMPMAFSLPTWETNMEKAKQKAVKENKGLLIEFTGSDWCGYCIVLKKNVLSNEAFLKPAMENYVFVELDFPKKALNAEQTEHNKKYEDVYQITGFPTIIFADASGIPVHSFVGNRSLENGISELNIAIERQKELSDLLKKQKDAEGEDRYKLIGKIAEIVPVKYFAHFYPNLIEDLKNDVNDASGVVRKLREHKAKVKFETIAEDIRNKKINQLDDCLQVVHDYLGKTPDIDINTKQNALELAARLYKNKKMLDESIKTYKEAIALVPESEIAPQMKLITNRLEADKDEVLTEMNQADQLSEFLSTISGKAKESPDFFIKELEGYLEKNDPVSYVRYGALQLIVFALLAENEKDEAMITLQKIIDLMEKDNEAVADSAKRIKSELGKDTGAFHKTFKEQWGVELINTFHLDRWTDYSLPTE